MSIHILTEETTLRSEVIVVAPPGENPERVVEAAMLQVSSARESVRLLDPPTDLFIDPPVYQSNRRWLVQITYVLRTTQPVEVQQK